MYKRQIIVPAYFDLNISKFPKVQGFCSARLLTEMVIEMKIRLIAVTIINLKSTFNNISIHFVLNGMVQNIYEFVTISQEKIK